jgi:phosphoribosyl 1,2-cyclic phosphodiesterase
VRGLLIETNYDEALLQQDTRRPWSVKQRITSRHGHLSNAAAAAVVAELDAPLQHVILAHLSRDCNAPDLAMASVTGAIAGRPAAIYCATQEAVSPPLRLTVT